MDGPRRSLRKREEKSYAESPDFIIEEALLAGSKQGRGNHASGLLKDIGNSVSLSNGDVEMESEEDDEDEELPLLPLPKELPPDVLCEKQAQIRKLQAQLRNEEMALVLLKKIRQSQLLAEQAAASSVKANPQTTANKPQHLAPSQPHRNSYGGDRGGSEGHSQSQGFSQHQRNSYGGKPITSGGKPSSGRERDYARQIAEVQQQIQNSQRKGSQNSDLSTLKQVGLDPKNLPPGLPANLVNLIGKGSLAAVPTNKLPEKPKPPPKAEETPQQKQAAAKLALRQQLEKTLLQIPPPKPPPPEMHFIPNPTNGEFVYLLGLEECVSKILNEDKEGGPQPLPFSCSQCHTDFTPTWKWDKGAKGREVKVICENCVTTNVKKALKAEHTNRLKAAFVKALQQEQELEAHMAAQEAQRSSSSSARVASPEPTARSRLPASLDVSVRTAPPRSSHQAPSSHQQSHHRSNSNSNNYTSAATVERAYQKTSRGGTGVNNSLPGSRHSNSRNSSRGGDTNHSSSNDTAARLAAAQVASLLPSSLTGSGSGTNGNVMNSDLFRGSATSSSSRSKADQQARDSANAMAALLGGGAGGYDLASMVALQQLQQQMLLGLGGSGSGGSGSTPTTTSSSSSGRRGDIGSSSNNTSAAALNSQLAAFSQQMMNPLYNYQAMAMAQAMAAAGLGNGGAGSSSGGSSSKSQSQSATNQMLEIQRQAAEQLQRQYLLDMIPPGSLSSPGAWGKK